MKKEKNTYPAHRRAASLIAALLLLAILALSLASCDLLPTGGSGGSGGGNITTVASGAPSTGTPPTAPVTQPVSFTQVISPTVPSEAGTYAYVAEVAAPSVVSILTEAIVYDRFNGSYVESGAGSGVVCYVDAERGRTYIITNNHVVEGYSTVSVYKDGEETEYPAEIIGTDWQTDLAVISVTSTDFVPATFGRSSDLRVGQEVAAIGNPLGTLGGTLTDGIIGALERELEIEGVTMTLVQHSAPVSPGNSGGGLFNLYGQLIGIVNAKSTGTGVEGLGYAIPIDLTLERVGQIIAQGYVSGTPFLGITYGTSSSGVVVSSYAYNSELEATNQNPLQSGDILYSLGGVPISEVSDVRKVLSAVEVGDTVEAVLYRANRFSYVPFTVNLTVHEYLPDWVSTGSPSDDGSGDMEFN